MQISTLIIVSGVLLTTGSSNGTLVNLLLDSSFESADAGQATAWRMTVRRSLWDADNSLKAPLMCDGPVGARSGRCSLHLEPPTVRDHLVFVSQFVSPLTSPVDNNHDLGSALLVSFWSHRVELDGLTSPEVDRSPFYLRVDIDYVTAGSRLTVRIKPNHVDEGRAEFVRSCVVVPNYGRVRALMMHFVVEDVRRLSTDSLQTSSLYVDDVSLNSLQTDEQLEQSLADGCEPYVDAFPRNRHVITDFLSPIIRDDANSITLATQLTVDRLTALEQIASKWRGHVSAALLIYDNEAVSTLRDVTRAYYRSSALRSHVTIHLVREDPANRKSKQRQSFWSIDDDGDDDDWKRYPVNFLRNVAISNVHTDHVFYVDADLVIAFTEGDLQRWIHAAMIHVGLTSSVTVDKIAFLVPVYVFHDASKEGETNFPRSKAELLATGSSYQPLPYTSHSVINYSRWKVAETAYRVEYMEDMEPYFVVQSTSPVMNDHFAGYGRDKCAYSRDLKRSGFEFFVLPQAFLVYTQDKVGTPTIYQRSVGVRPEMFFSIEFHRRDIEVGHIRLPSEYNLKPPPLSQPSVSSSWSKLHADSCDQREEDSCVGGGGSTVYAGEHHNEEKSAKNIDEDIPEADEAVNDVCAAKSKVLENPSEIDHGRYGSTNFDERIDLLVEMLMVTYGATTFVELSTSSTVEGSLNVMLPLMQPEAVIVVQLGTSLVCDHVSRGIFETYRTNNENLDSTLKDVTADHLGPKLYVIDASRFPVSLFASYIGVLFGDVTDDDVIVILQYVEDVHVLHVICESLPPRWRLYRLSGRHVLLKSETLSESQPDTVPSFPVCPTKALQPEVQKNVDVILFTKNRPLQTFAFLESLSRMVSGVGTVWAIYASQSTLTDSGYELVDRCFKHASFHIEFIHESDQLDLEDSTSPQTLGKTLVDTLAGRCHADHVMLAVDEMIWLRPVDLLRATKPLASCSSGQDVDELFSVQLRLGENNGLFHSLPDRTNRFQRIVEESDVSGDRMYAFYPRRWPYDFGYVLNIDGVIVRRRDLLADFSDNEVSRITSCTCPGCIETTWIRESLSRRSRQWHVMYSRWSAVVNNEVQGSVRVASEMSGPGDKTMELVKLLVIEKKKIDIDAFIRDYADAVQATHTRLPVDYVELDADC